MCRVVHSLASIVGTLAWYPAPWYPADWYPVPCYVPHTTSVAFGDDSGSSSGEHLVGHNQNNPNTTKSLRKSILDLGFAKVINLTIQVDLEIFLLNLPLSTSILLLL